MNQLLRKAYRKIPEEVRNKLLLIPNYLPLEIVYGKEYRDWKKFLKASEFWDETRIRDYQKEKLRKLCISAYEDTIYYKKIFDETGFNPYKLNNAEEISKLPFLTKSIIQEHKEELLNNKIASGNRIYVTTGGSTGIPIGFYQPENDRIRESAFVNYMWGMVGYKHTDKMAVIRGEYRGEKGTAQIKGNRLIISSYHTAEEELGEAYEALKKYRPQYLHVYISALYILCDFMKRNHLPPIRSIRAVLATSENVYDFQRVLIEEVMQCRVYSFYGHTEHACIACECEMNNNYHLMWQYGYTELIGKDDRPALCDGEEAEIVATTFDNDVMPLIRYRTMDIVTVSTEKCGCKRTYPLIHNVQGRIQEMLITKEGRCISMTALNMHTDLFDHVSQYQYYQDNLSVCVLNIVRRDDYTSEDEERIRQEIQSKLGESLTLQIHYVDEIERTKAGKYRFLIQKLPAKFKVE